MIKEATRSYLNVKFYIEQISCDHCHTEIESFPLYEPQLCMICWNEYSMRVSELVHKENDYEKLLDKIKKYNIIIPEDD